MDKTAKLRTTFTRIAAGQLSPTNFGSLVKTAMRAGLFRKSDVANTMAVQPDQVFRVANALPQRERAQLSQQLLTIRKR